MCKASWGHGYHFEICVLQTKRNEGRIAGILGELPPLQTQIIRKLQSLSLSVASSGGEVSKPYLQQSFPMKSFIGGKTKRDETANDQHFDELCAYLLLLSATQLEISPLKKKMLTKEQGICRADPLHCQAKGTKSYDKHTRAFRPVTKFKFLLDLPQYLVQSAFAQ